MDLHTRQASIQELRSRNKVLVFAVAGLVLVSLLLAASLTRQSKIVVLQIPGLPSEAVIERDSMDRRAQQVVVQAVTTAIAQINPANAQYQKKFLQAFLSAKEYTRLSQVVDARVAQLQAQRELGSYYWVTTELRYDPAINRHFVIGDLHTVNAAKDTSEKWVFEYALTVENYRPVITEIATYPGDKPHDSAWTKEAKK